MTLQINAAFDSGNIHVVAIDGDRVDLEIVRDTHSDFYQWFHFRVAGAAGRRLTFRILNAGGSAYPLGWPGYRVRASTDREDWRTAATRYDNGVLEWTWTGDAQLVWFAYWAPYPLERHDALVARLAAWPGVEHRELGRSLQGRAIDCLTIGTGPRQVWLFARQHPGESMAEWWMEGALERLTTLADETTAGLLAAATIHCVPNMNPDGSFLGHLRTNAAGVNLNREWHAPSLDRSPEVLCVRDAMDASGVDFALDAHGDEAIPANFLVGYEGIPSWAEPHGARFTEFARRLAAATPDFQLELGYPKSPPGRANLSMSTNQIAERFGAVACTLEMPFKDHDPAPDRDRAFSPARAKRLAHACIDTLAGMIGQLG